MDGKRASRPACSEYCPCPLQYINLITCHSYLRTRPAAQAIQFTVDQSFLKKKPQAVMPTPSPSPSPNSKAKAEPSTPIKANGTASVKVENVTPSLKDQRAPLSPTETHSNPPSPSPGPVTPSNPELVSLDPRTAKAAAEDPEFAAALKRQRDRELEEAKLMCSLENKEACTMCSA
jgi:ribonucleoside-diphosphate reductase subunit M1